MESNSAAWLDAAGVRLRVAAADLPTPGEGQIVIKSHALAINPIDHKIQDSGVFIQNWPAVFGEDVAGEVHEVGAGVTKFKKGDRVVAHAIMFIKQQAQWGGFQKFVLADAAFVAQIPTSISYTAASVLPLALDAAAAGLYSPLENGGLGLPYPSLQPKSSGKTIVVWGGASSVGSQALQLAAASGVQAVAVAGPSNLDYVKKLGAVDAFDYRSKSVVADVLAAVQRAGGEFVGVFDAISMPVSYEHTVPIVEKSQGKHLAVVTPVQPENVSSEVKVGTVFAINPVVHPLWANWITPALEKGQLKCVPEVVIVGNGLESIQRGLDANKAGVSAKKIVVTV